MRLSKKDDASVERGLLASLVLHLPVKPARGGRLWPINNLDRDVKCPAGYCSQKKGEERCLARALLFRTSFSLVSRQAGCGCGAGQASPPAQLSPASAENKANNWPIFTR